MQDTLADLPALLSSQQRAMLARVRGALVQEKKDDRDSIAPGGNGEDKEGIKDVEPSSGS